ncbi:MAG TPA: response regulator transcription factor [Sediminibacterium sp.]|nr:response regulator transcription factor [Sediminibacterium sp.]
MKLALIKLAIVDDHQIVVDGLLSLLENIPDFKIMISTTSAKEMLKLLPTNDIDVLLTDIMMPEMSGQQLAQQVKQLYPGIKIFALSMIGEGSVVDVMINDADISGYALKNIGKEELSLAIKKIAGGGIYFSESILEELEKFGNQKKHNQEIHISAREIEIIKLIEKEYSTKDIAKNLCISERTVETHRKNILRKTNTGSALGIIKYAYKHRLIT